jgi:pimeloyl-ACP methyl ester carboxylesterase
MERREIEKHLPDGRRLFIEVAGPEESPLVIFQTGTPGSRHLYEAHVEACLERGLRLACYSRPGYGGSDRRPGRSPADCALDTAIVADALGAESFYAVGYSSGGDYALACAALLSARVISVAACASGAPRSTRGKEWMVGTGKGNLAEFAALAAGPPALERFLRKAVAEMQQIKTREHLLAGYEGFLCEADRECLQGRLLRFQLESLELIVRDSIWGWFDDDKAMWNEWGFDLTQIDVPLSIWHGGEDKVVPMAEGECLARLLPAANFHLLSGHGHFSLFATQFGSILDELLAPR